MKSIYSLIIIVVIFNLADACKFIPRSDETKFCCADYINIIKLNTKSVDGNQVNFSVIVLKMIKNSRNLTDNTTLHTSLESASCGLGRSLEVNQTYLMGGYYQDSSSNLSISSPGFSRKLDGLTEDEKNKYYKMLCPLNCNGTSCPDGGENTKCPSDAN